MNGLKPQRKNKNDSSRNIQNNINLSTCSHGPAVECNLYP
nr:MAG TPA: hypothetical protein [Caudoviricetes sp.]